MAKTIVTEVPQYSELEMFDIDDNALTMNCTAPTAQPVRPSYDYNGDCDELIENDFPEQLTLGQLIG